MTKKLAGYVAKACNIPRHDDLYDLPTDYAAIPNRTLRAIRQYVESRRPVGDFVTAVLENNLAGALFQADTENREALDQIVLLVHNRIPSYCHGSKKAVQEWIDAGND
ncbi:MAG: hypothetical protein ACW99J_19250 [Candidatus Thorarchaeota archaeon]|jgi:hypothetical protein